MTEDRKAPEGEGKEMPFPDSLCHTCAAPVKYIRTARSTFLYCPIFRRYPPQPVRSCPEYRPLEGPAPIGPAKRKQPR